VPDTGTLEAVMIARRAAVILFALPLAGCLEPPVSESLDVRMLKDGASVVSVGVVLRDPSDYDKSPRVQQRLESAARELEEGSDPWSKRLRSVEPIRERDIVDRDHGKLRRVVRHAALDGPTDLREFMRDTGVGVVYADGEGWAELTLTPGRSGRATSASVKSSTPNSMSSPRTSHATLRRRRNFTTTWRRIQIARAFASAKFFR
jgi:hypothetical protein